MEENKNFIQRNKKKIILFWGGFVFLWASFFIFMILISMDKFGELPSIEELEDPEKNIATEVISQDGKVIGKYYKENRSLAKYGDISGNLINALISTEDERFFEHSGIDLRSFLRAIGYLGQKGGASTITQQLAKMYFTKKPSRNIFIRVIQKLKEWIISIKLERQYTKEEILEMYLNKFDFLYLAVGINSASKIYFDKTPIELSVEESAVLVGMAKNPSAYNPKRFPENSLKRRNIVYRQMYKNGYINDTQLDTLSKRPVVLNFSPESHDEGLATYFREHLRGELKVWIKNNPKPDGTFYNLERDGLKIYTSIDSKMQKYAEESVKEHIHNLQNIFKLVTYSHFKDIYPFVTPEEDSIIMTQSIKSLPIYKKLISDERSEGYILKKLKKKKEMKIYTFQGMVDTILSTIDSIRHYKSLFQAGMMAVNPQNGFIKAWVGGVDYKQFKYDNVFQMRRQVGSTFKPFVYGTAIDQLKMSPCDKIPNTNVVLTKEKWGLPDKDWSPKNAGGKIDGRMYTLTKALAKSINTITAKLVERIGSTRPIINFVRRLGITSSISSGPAMSLGTADISLYEMVGAYSTFANKGIHIKPMYLLKIKDKNGRTLANFSPETKEAISEESAYVITKLLEGVVNQGSGIRLKTTEGAYNVWGLEDKPLCTGYPYGFTNSIAGKTGTTQNQSDGWFIGMVPNLVTGVWVGHDTRAVHFNDLYYGQGASVSLPIWGLFMKKCYEDKTLNVSKEDFEKPDRPISIELDCDKVMLKKHRIEREENIEDEEF